jgi:hypothetical protein
MNVNFLVVIFYVEKAKNGMFLGIKTPPDFPVRTSYGKAWHI